MDTIKQKVKKQQHASPGSRNSRPFAGTFALCSNLKQAPRAHLQFLQFDLAPRLPDYFLAAAATQRPPIPAARSDQSRYVMLDA